MSCTQKQQLVCFPKVRVYKPWFRYFNDHKDFRNEGTVHLFSLMALFSYANFRSNERVINGDRYMEAPGQWICKLGALPRILRVHSKAQALELMEYFQDHGFLTFEILDEEKEILRFTISDWKEHCTHLQYMMNFSRSGRTVDESRAWLKRIIITWAILNSLGFIMAYVTPFFAGGTWTP